jgi:5-hydroxyisourate hydrolase
MSPITTHVLDISRGRPAADVAVVLESRGPDGAWREIGWGTTDADGRITDLLPDKTPLSLGIYRLRFATEGYFHGQGVQTFYPEVHVIVQVNEPAEHYHIPLLLSSFGYSTYRGR